MIRPNVPAVAHDSSILANSIMGGGHGDGGKARWKGGSHDERNGTGHDYDEPFGW